MFFFLIIAETNPNEEFFINEKNERKKDLNPRSSDLAFTFVLSKFSFHVKRARVFCLFLYNSRRFYWIVPKNSWCNIDKKKKQFLHGYTHTCMHFYTYNYIYPLSYHNLDDLQMIYTKYLHFLWTIFYIFPPNAVLSALFVSTHYARCCKMKFKS